MDVTSWKSITCVLAGVGDWKADNAVCSYQLAQQCFVSLSEISALRFITDSKGSGINLIKDAYHLHYDDPAVVESICVLINEMAQYGEMVVVFVKSLPFPHPQKD